MRNVSGCGRSGPAAPAIVLALSAALLGCGEEVESDLGMAAGVPRVSLAAVPGERSEAAGYRTHLYSEHDADVHSRLDPDLTGPALIEAVHVEIGDQVSAGQVLATLDDAEARVAVQAAGAEAEEARSTFRRMEQLREQEVVTEAQYDAARFAKQRAEAALARAELELARTRVRAPFAGVVSRRYIRVGELIESGQPLFRVTAMAPLRARILVPEERSGAFLPGAAVELADAVGGRATAAVLVVSPTVDPGSGTREVLVELAADTDLRPGASVTVRAAQSSARRE